MQKSSFIYRFLNDFRNYASIAFVAMFAMPVYGQGAFVEEYLGFADGLPSLNITAVTQDSQKLIWMTALGTGLVRYDGTTFKVFNQLPGSVPRLRDPFLKDIILDRKGRLWIGHNAGIDVLQPKTMQMVQSLVLTGKDKTVLGQANSLCLTREGDIWVAAYNKGIFRARDSDPDRLEYFQELKAANYVNLSPNDQLWCITAEGELYRFENDQFKIYTIPGILKKELTQLQIKPIENQGGQLVGLRLLLQDESNRVYSLNPLKNGFEPGNPPDGITVLTTPEMSRRMMESASPLAKSPLFYHAFKTFKDNQGLIWVAPQYGGLFKLKPRELAFTKCPDLEGVSLRGMLEAPDGRIYIATYNGLFQYDAAINRAKRVGKTWHDIFFNLAAVQGDTVLGLSETQGVCSYDLRTPFHFTKANTAQLTKDFAFFASMPMEDGWFLAGNQQVFRVHTKDLQVQPYALIPAPLSVQTFCFKTISDGRIWVGTTEGLFILTNKGECELPALRKDPRFGEKSRINDIYEDVNGRIWFATHTYGLICYNPQTNEMISFDQSNGLSTSETYKIIGSHGGKYIWVSTFSGLYCIEIPEYKIRLFNEKDGISGNEFNTGSFLQTHNGEFYFGGVRGLTRFSPDHFHPFSAPLPTPYISELVVEDIYSSVITTINLPKKDTLLLFSNGQNTLEFYFGSDNYFRPKSNSYYVKLQKIDSDWVPLGSNTKIKYYRLNPGRYTLSVKFNNNADFHNSQVYTIQFEIDEVYYKKWWFITLSFGVLLLLIWGFFLLRRRRQLREERLRRNIAYDLHNTLGGKISGITHMLHLIDRLHKEGKPFQAELQQILDLARRANGTISDVIWVLTKTDQVNTSLLNRMEDYADKWLRMAHVKVEFEHNLSDKLQEIPFSVQHVLLSVYKEMLGNIIKHTFSDFVFIRFVVNPDNTIELSVRNEFKQRNLDAPSGGQGLLIIREHAARIGGMVSVKSAENSFEIRVKFENAFPK